MRGIQINRETWLAIGIIGSFESDFIFCIIFLSTSASLLTFLLLTEISQHITLYWQGDRQATPIIHTMLFVFRNMHVFSSLPYSLIKKGERRKGKKQLSRREDSHPLPARTCLKQPRSSRWLVHWLFSSAAQMLPWGRLPETRVWWSQRTATTTTVGHNVGSLPLTPQENTNLHPYRRMKCESPACLRGTAEGEKRRDACEVPEPTWKRVQSAPHPPAWPGYKPKIDLQGRWWGHCTLPVQWAGSW